MKSIVKFMKLLSLKSQTKSLKSKNLGFTGDANMEKWPKSVKKLQEKYKSIKIVIPHHGMWGDTSLITHTLSLFK